MITSLHFAPIQGYTDAIYREVHNAIFGGVDAYYTPFIRLEKGEIRKHDAKEFSEARNASLFTEKRIIPQLLPGNSDEMKTLVDQVAEAGYKNIDINLGCPFPMIAKRHKGCGLLPYPDEVNSIFAVTKQYADLKFSAKMRLGLNNADEWKALTQTLNEAELTHITIHPRIGKQQYKGDIDFASFDEFIASIKHPIVYNGEIKTAVDAKNLLEKHPNIAGIMMGRGLLENPNLANEIKGKGTETKTLELKNKFIDFINTLLEKYGEVLDGGEPQIMKKVVTIWDYLLPGLEKRDLKKIVKSKNTDDYLHNSIEAINNFFHA